MMDVSRISQVLPSVKCSKCGAGIRVDAVASHVCAMNQSMPPRLPAIVESSPGPMRALTEPLPPPHQQQRSWQNSQRPSTREGQRRPEVHGEADAVLGRLNTMSRPLGQRLAAPAKVGRAGPVQTRDPRMTVMPLHAVHPPYKREDDTRSIMSRGSNRSQGSHSSNGSAGHQRQRVLDPQTDVLAGQDSGPFGIAGVASRLDPTVFVAPEIVAQNKKQPKRGQYDDWQDQEPVMRSQRQQQRQPQSMDRQYDARPHSRPSTAGSSTHSSQYQAQDRAQMNFRFDRDDRPGTGQTIKPHRPSTASRENDPYARFGPDSIPPPGRFQLAHASQLPPHIALPLPPQQHQQVYQQQEARHMRQNTSSSVGTVMTSQSGFSVRSSMSSATPEPFAFAMPPADSCSAHHDDKTPRAFVKLAQKATAMSRSGTTESFDRLLADIGASIDDLQPPPKDLGQLEIDSPSSHYSPIPAPNDKLITKPTAAANAATMAMQGGEQHQAAVREMPIKRLGSPASLRSKETVASSASDESLPPQQHVASNGKLKPASTLATCRACKSRISPGQKTVSSKDGKLSGKYHKDCFRCTACFCSFAGGEFYVHEDRPYCAQHYHEANGSLCEVCGHGVEGACVADGNKRWHAACFEQKGRQTARPVQQPQTHLPAGVVAGIKHASYDHF